MYILICIYMWSIPLPRLPLLRLPRLSRFISELHRPRDVASDKATPGLR